MVYAVMEWTHTKAALECVENILTCGSCNSIVQDPCNLGSCEHFLCGTCAHDLAGPGGGQCPRCGVPAIPRDLAADRQVDRAVKLCHKLSKLLSQLDLGDVTSSPYSPSVRQGRSSREAPCSQPGHNQPRPQSAGTSPVTRRTRRTKPSPKKTVQHGACKRQSGRQGGGDEASRVREEHEEEEDGSKPADDESTSEEPPVGSQKITRNMRRRESTEQPWPEVSKPKEEAAQKDAGKLRRGRKQGLKVTADTIDSTSNVEASTSGLHAETSGKNTNAVTPKAKGCNRKISSVPNDDVEMASEVIVRTSGSPEKVLVQKHLSKASSSNQKHSCDESAAVIEKNPANSTTKRGRRLQPGNFKSPSRSPVTKLTTPKRLRRAGATTPVAHNKQGSSFLSSPLVRSGNNSPVPRSPLAARPCHRKNAKGETPLHVAAIKGDLGAVQELLADGAPINIKDNAGWTPLHEACNHGFEEIASLLLDNGAFINAPGLDNDTPLHDAVQNGLLDCAKLLVKRGASTTQRNLSGLTPVHLAQTAAMLEVLESAPHSDEGAVGHSSQLEPSPASHQVALLGTALNREQKPQLTQLAGLLHAQVVDEFSHAVTHVVSAVNADGLCPRTLKYLQAVSCGKWIVNFDWVEQCLGHGEHVSEEPFEVPGATTSPDSQAPRKGRERAFCQLPGLFDGCHFYLQGEFCDPTPNKDQLAVLLKLGGGSLLSREPKLESLDQLPVTVPYHVASDSPLAHCSHYVIHDSRDRGAELFAPRLCSAPASWLLDCIAHYTLALEPHMEQGSRSILE